MGGFLDSGGMFPGEHEGLPSFPVAPTEHMTPTPDSRGDIVDISYWEETPAKPQPEREALLRGLGASPIRETIEQSILRHPAAHRPRQHQF